MAGTLDHRAGFAVPGMPGKAGFGGPAVGRGRAGRPTSPSGVGRSSSACQVRAGGAGSGPGRCGAVGSRIQIAAEELQGRGHQEPRCEPVAFAPVSVGSRAVAERDKNEADAEIKAAGGEAHAGDGMAVPVLPWPDQAPHRGDGPPGSGAVSWCVHRDASCRLRCRLPRGRYQSGITLMDGSSSKAPAVRLEPPGRKWAVGGEGIRRTCLFALAGLGAWTAAVRRRTAAVQAGRLLALLLAFLALLALLSHVYHPVSGLGKSTMC